MRHRTHRFWTRPAILLLAAASILEAQPGVPADIDMWVERTRREFDVPGIAVSIVKDGRTVFAKGYGVRRLGESAVVDEQTIFGLASNSKAFTAAALAMLVDEGKLRWDDAVIQHIPSFQMYDPYVTRELTVRDTLCHRTGLGLGAGDLLFWPDTNTTRDEVVAAARWIRPASSLRSRYAYNNLMFVVAGQILEKVSRQKWDDFVRERILEPAGMRQARISSASFRPGENIAFPHSRGWDLEGTLVPIAPTRDDVWAAAAGIKANALDMARWLTVQLALGQVAGGPRLWTEAQARQMWAPHTLLQVTAPAPGFEASKANFIAYGLGWNLRDQQGRKIVMHTGGLTGMVTTTLMVPEERLALVVLTNQEEGGAMAAISQHILDHNFGLAPTDWIALYAKRRAEQMERAKLEARKQEEARARDSRPSLPLVKYAGTYRDAWYGEARITLSEGQLRMHMARTPTMKGALQHWQHDTFRAVWADETIPDALVTFHLNHEGAIERVALVAASSLADFSFDYHDLLFQPVGKQAP